MCASMGLGQAWAAESGYIMERLGQLYEDLEETDLDTIRVSRDRINEILRSYEKDPEEWSNYEAIIDVVWSKIESKKNASIEDYPDLTKEAILKIVLNLASMSYDPQFNAFSKIRADEELRPAMDAMVKLAGVQEGLNAVSMADADDFVEQLEDALDLKLDKGANLYDALLSLAGDFSSKYNALLNELKEDNVTAKILYEYNITMTDLMMPVLIIAGEETPSGDKVDEGYESLRIFAAALIGFKEDKGSGRRPGPIYIPPVSSSELSAERLPLPDNYEEMFSDQLEQLARELQQNAEDGDSQASLMRDLINKIERTLRDATSMTVDGEPEIVDGKADFTLEADSLIEELDENAQLRENLLAKAAEILGSDQQLELEWVIQIPHEGADNEVKVPYEAIANAKELGITRLTVQVGGALVSVPLTQIEDDIIFIVEHTDVPSDLPGDVRGSREVRAEDSEGNVLEDLGGEQFKVGVPVDGRNPSNPYLTMFRIGEDGVNTNVGGQYNDETGLFEAYRTSFSPYAVVENWVQFDDIEPVRSWAYQAIHELAARGIVNGRGDGEFDPLAPLTRAEFATMLVNLLNVYDEHASESFTDVADGSWYQPFIASAVQAGLVYGRSDDTFAPQDQVTRAEMAVMAARALKQQLSFPGEVNIEAQLNKFNDSDGIFEGMQEDLALAIREGIIGGVAEGQLQPHNDSNRAQAAVIIYRLYQILQ